MNQTPNIDERPSPEPRWLFPVIDVVLVFVAFVLAYIMRYDLQLILPVLDPNTATFDAYIPFAAIYAVILYLNYQSIGLYKNVRGRAWMEEVGMIANGVTNGAIVLLALFFILQPRVTSRLMLIYVVAWTVILLSVARLMRRIVLAYLRDKGIGIQRVLMVGMNDAGQSVLRTLIARPELGYKPVGYIDEDWEGQTDLGRIKALGTLDKLPEIIKTERIDIVFITLDWKHRDRILEMVEKCRKAHVEVRILPDVFQLNLRQVQIENLNGIPLIGMNGSSDFQGTNRLFKRALDISLIVLVSPILLLIFGTVALAIRLESSGPVLYRQRRVGESGKPFFMYKFRSMIPEAEKLHADLVKESGEDPRHPKLKDDPRITRIGKFIRRTSLDELPNLINVLLGQMSIVGPRPPTPDEVELYEPWHMQRLKIIPGITGLWQVSGRSNVPFEEMCLLDIYYIENWSLMLDIQIMLMTLPRVLLRHGAY